MEFSFLDSASIVGIALRSLALLVLTAAIGFALRRRSSAVQHGIWAIGMAGCSAMPIVMTFSPSWTLPFLPAGLSMSVASFDETTSNAPVSPAVIYSETVDDNRSVSDFERPVAYPGFEKCSSCPRKNLRKQTATAGFQAIGWQKTVAGKARWCGSGWPASVSLSCDSSNSSWLCNARYIRRRI